MTSDWRKSLKVYADRIDALSLRERAMIFGGILAVLFTIAYQLVFAPMRVEQAKLEKGVTAKISQLNKIQTDLQPLLKGLAQDPDETNRNRIAELMAQLEASGADVAAVTGGMVTPIDMTRLVQEVLASNRFVKVVKVENIPPVSVLTPQPADATKPAVGGMTLYQHGMRIEIKANYLDIVRTLRTMESLPWRIYWGEIEIKTEKYPVSHASVVFYTLNQTPAWMGI